MPSLRLHLAEHWAENIGLGRRGLGEEMKVRPSGAERKFDMRKNQIVTFAFAAALACAVILTSSARAGEPCEPGWHTFTSGGQIGVSLDPAISVRTMMVWNGDLIAAGGFITAGGQTVNRIARWDGSAWHPFTSGGQIGMDGGVFALTEWNGDLIAAGNFITAGGQTVNRIARWDGSSGGWHPFPSGGQIGLDGAVHALAVFNGDLIVGGQFTTAGGKTVNRIARWDGSAWHAFPSPVGVPVGVNNSIVVMLVWNGDLIIGGDFIMAGAQTVNRIARWDGSSGGWHPFISSGVIGVSSYVRGLMELKGDLIVAGGFATAGGQTVFGIARWDGATWHPFTSGGQIGVGGAAWPLEVYNGDLVTAGNFLTAGGQTVNHIARWDGSAWHPFTAGEEVGVDAIVRSLAIFNDSLVAGGYFTTAGGKTVNQIARWDGCLDSPVCPGDLTGSGGTGVPDLLILLGAWGPCPAPCAADLTGSGSVGVPDLLVLLGAWGPCP